MLLRLAEAVGRVVLAGRELVRLSGWVDHMITMMSHDVVTVLAIPPVSRNCLWYCLILRRECTRGPW